MNCTDKQRTSIVTQAQRDAVDDNIIIFFAINEHQCIPIIIIIIIIIISIFV